MGQLMQQLHHVMHYAMHHVMQALPAGHGAAHAAAAGVDRALRALRQAQRPGAARAPLVRDGQY